MDQRPQELLVLTLDGLVLQWSRNSSGSLPFTQFSAELRDLQVRGGGGGYSENNSMAGSCCNLPGEEKEHRLQGA